MEEFPLPRMNTLPDDLLRAGEQYFFDLAGNIKKGPVTKPVDCHCGPSFQKFEKKLERDKQHDVFLELFEKQLDLVEEEQNNLSSTVKKGGEKSISK